MKLLQNIALYISLAEGFLNLDPTALFAFGPLYSSKEENCPIFLPKNTHFYQFFQKGQLDSVSRSYYHHFEPKLEDFK